MGKVWGRSTRQNEHITYIKWLTGAARDAKATCVEEDWEDDLSSVHKTTRKNREPSDSSIYIVL